MLQNFSYLCIVKQKRSLSTSCYKLTALNRRMYKIKKLCYHELQK